MCRMVAGSGVLFFFLFMPLAEISAQNELPSFVISLIEEQAAEGVSSEELVSHFEEMLLHPLDINAATRRELEESRLFGLFQVESLLEWRKRYGAVRSLTELAMVEGFNADFVADIRRFISTAEVPRAASAGNTFSVKGKKKWAQEGLSFTAKESFSYGKLAFNAVIDNDAGERFPDFVSLSARYKDLYLGSFTARFGQGLVLWKAFSMSAFGSPSGIARNSNGLQEYRSTDEANFLRGAAWSGSSGNLRLTALVSWNALDARVENGSYTSIVTGGIHVTDAEREKRRTMHETLVGGNIALDMEGWRIGFSAVAYRYDKRNGRKVQDYNRYQQYDGWWGNAGVNFYASAGSLRFFGEAAVDAGLAPAVIIGGVWSPSYNFETSFSARCYSPSYIATHAGAHSTLSSVSNQIGATWSAKAIKGSWTAQADMEYVYYPWKRYRSEAGGQTCRGRVQLAYVFPGGASLQARLNWNNVLKAGLKLEFPLGAGWQLSGRIEGNTRGAGCYADLRWKPGRNWDLSARVTYWRTDGWESRIYFHERGVPQSFSVEPRYGKGIGEYLVVKYSPNRRYEFWLKLQQDYAAYFVRIFIPG